MKKLFPKLWTYPMKAYFVGFALLLSACTSLYPVDATRAEVQHQISNEQLLKTGDSVKIVTQDGGIHKFQITDIDLEQRAVIGKKVTIAIDDIIAVEVRKGAIGKSMALMGTAAFIWSLMAALGSTASFGW